MVVTGFYKDIPRFFVNPQLRIGGYNALAAAIVLQAVSDWEWLCRRCGDGKPYSFADCNFAELEAFFIDRAESICPNLGLTGEQMLKRLMPMKDAAMKKRQKLIDHGKVNDFGARLGMVRVWRNLSKRAMAELLGVQYKVYERWERGEVIPHHSTQARIIAKLNMSWEHFFS